MKKICTCFIGLMICSAVWAAEAPRIMGDDGATYEDLIREARLVTITLDSGAQDSNVKITGFHKDRGTLSVVDSTGVNTAYKFEKIREVRVQKEFVRRGEKPDPESVLTADDKKIVETAANRALAIFTDSHIQPIKMMAANILAASDNDHNKDALSYLNELSTSNDAATAMLAASFLWQNGQPISDEIMLAGFNSGNRGAKATAALLAGLMKADQFRVELRKLLGDPSAEINPRAAIALGRINDTESVPELLESLSTITEAKAEAAVIALGEMHNPEVARRLEELLEKADGLQRFRIIRALYKQGNEQVKQKLRSEFLKEPAYERPAALILAEDGDPEALKFLRDYLQKQWDPNVENLVFRALAGMALYINGDIQSKGIIADVLATPPGDIYSVGKSGDQKFKEESVRRIQIAVCTMMGNSMRRDMLPLLAGPIQSSDPVVALYGCRAAVQIGNKDFGKRVKETGF